MKFPEEYLSIDIGGTKILVIIYSQDYQALKSEIYKTSLIFKEKHLKELEILFLKIVEKFGKNFKKVGISFNCAINKDNIIYSTLLGGEVSVNIKKICKNYFDFKEFISNNDVVCMAKAENYFGYGKKYKNYVLVNLGTGIRVVAVSDGKIIRGYKNLAGEISPLKIYLEETKNYIELDNLLAGKGLKNLTNLLSNKEVEINEEFFKDIKNKKFIKIYLKYLSKLLTKITYFYNPEVIIFSGSITKSSDYWLEDLKKFYYSKTKSVFLVKDLLISNVKNSASLGAILI